MTDIIDNLITRADSRVGNPLFILKVYLLYHINMRINAWAATTRMNIVSG